MRQEARGARGQRSRNELWQEMEEEERKGMKEEGSTPGVPAGGCW